MTAFTPLRVERRGDRAGAPAGAAVEDDLLALIFREEVVPLFLLSVEIALGQQHGGRGDAALGPLGRLAAIDEDGLALGDKLRGVLGRDFRRGIGGKRGEGGDEEQGGEVAKFHGDGRWDRLRFVGNVEENISDATRRSSRSGARKFQSDSPQRRGHATTCVRRVGRRVMARVALTSPGRRARSRRGDWGACGAGCASCRRDARGARCGCPSPRRSAQKSAIVSGFDGRLSNHSVV